MKIIEKQSSGEIARFLRKKILTGSYPAGKSLKSLRALAEDFGVSRQVIHSALGVLAAENLVESRPRQRYLVCDPSRRETKGLFLFASLVNSEVNSYLKRIMEVLCPPILPSGYSSWSRLTNEKDLNSWNRELSQIASITGINCLLVYSPRLTRKNVEETMKMPFPVIFLGDFEDENCYTSETCNIINDATVNIDLCYDYIEAFPGDGKIGMLSFSRDIFYVNEYLNAAEEKARKRNISLEIFSLPRDFTAESALVQDRIVEDLISDLPSDLKYIYMAGLEYDRFKKYLKERLPDVPVLSTDNTSKEIPHIVADFSPYLEKTIECVKKAERNINIAGRHKIILPSKIVSPIEK